MDLELKVAIGEMAAYRRRIEELKQLLVNAGKDPGQDTGTRGIAAYYDASLAGAVASSTSLVNLLARSA